MNKGGLEYIPSLTLKPLRYGISPLLDTTCHSDDVWYNYKSASMTSHAYCQSGKWDQQLCSGGTVSRYSVISVGCKLAL